MSIRNTLLALCLGLAGVCAQAEPLANLYQVREPLTQADEDRDALLRRALDTLVLRLTGTPEALQQPGLAALRQSPQQIVSQFGVTADGAALLVEFDPASSERVLRQAGLPLWGNNRPALLAWWLEESTDGSSQLLGDGQEGAEVLRRAAQHRGLPLRLPLADLDEQLAVTAQTLAAGELQALRPLSERYAADVLLAVQTREAEGQWQGSWRIEFLDQHAQGQAVGADPAQLADAVMLAVLQRLAGHFVAAPGAVSDLQVQVQGVDLARYAQLEQLLEPLGGRLLSIDGDRLLYAVKASPEQLRAQLGLLQLRELPAETPVSDAAAQPNAPVTPTVPSNRLTFGW